MTIRELNLTHFGKFQNRDIELGPRMNIIYGSNEAGKSTVHGFIHAMLFGARRMRGRAAASDMYSRYQPWDNKTSYEGTLIFEHEGRNYRLYRNFYKEEQTVHLVDVELGREIDLPGGSISDFIPGLTEENYKNTISISQSKATMDDQFSLSLQSYAANMSMTGTQSLSFGRALEYLKQEKRKLARGSSADTIAQLNEKIREMETNLTASNTDGSSGLSYENNIATIQSRILSVQNHLKSLAQQQAQCQVSEGMLLQQEMQQKQELAQIKAKKEKLSKEIEAHQFPEEKEPYNGEQTELRENVPVQPPNPSSAPASLRLGIGVILVSIFAALAAILLKDRIPSIALYTIFTICVIGLIIGIIAGLRAFRSWGVSDNLPEYKFGVKENPTSAAWPEEKAYTEDIPDYDFNDSNDHKNRDIRTAYNTCLQQEARLNCSLEETAKKIRRLAEQKAALTAAVTKQNQACDQLRRQLEKQNWEQEKRNERANRLEDYREALETAKSTQQQLQQELDCVQTAQDIIESLSGEIHENFGTQLNASVERTMQEITGSHRRYTLSKDFKIAVDNTRDYVDIDRLSKGTIDQLYLSLRINAAGILFARQNMPLILDDTFAYYDDTRLKSLLKWLTTYHPGQILLLTCHHREEEILEEINCDYNYVNLDSAQT